MKTNVAETSINNYIGIQNDGTETTQCERILSFMGNGLKLTRREIARALQIETGACAGRCNKLLKEKKLVKGEKRKCSISDKLVGTISIQQNQLF